jgi:hypothetical protein
MGTTFLKRQKEMKRLEKAREKAERRAQKKLAGRTETDGLTEDISAVDTEVLDASIAAPAEPEPKI